jgi:glucose-1-phosphate thymidylyltransferase
MSTSRRRRGVLLAGGSGTRLYPVTQAVSKQLLPVYDKPMVYYPLATLMLAGIRDVLVITTPHEQALFQRLLGDGSQWGLAIQYAVQPSPDGLAQALIIAQDFLQGEPACLVLGDNIFYGHDLSDTLQRVNAREDGATVFGYRVSDPRAYGVVEFDAQGRAIGLEEKPTHPRSNYVVTGVYFYDGHASAMASTLQPSARGELEITDLNRLYLNAGSLHVELLGRGTAWLDTGSHESLLSAGQFIETIERRQGLKVACPEEIAWRMRWITDAQVERLAEPLRKTQYGQYLLNMLREAVYG